MNLWVISGTQKVTVAVVVRVARSVADWCLQPDGLPDPRLFDCDCDVPVLCLCCACAVPVLCMCCACAVPVLCMCCACAMPVL